MSLRSNLHIISKFETSCALIAVYLCKHKDDTIKDLYVQKQFKESMHSNFAKEVAAMTILKKYGNYINLMLDYWYDEDFKMYVLVTPYKENGDLFDFVKQRYMSIRDKLKMCYYITRALHTMHQNGILHRDLKMENILLDEKLNPLICDFSFSEWIDDLDPFNRYLIEDAKVAHEIIDNKETITVNNTLALSKWQKSLMGTLGHISPELHSTGEATVKSDIFALGVLFFQMLTSTQAFPDNIWRPIDDYYFPETFESSLKDLIISTVAKNPDDRPPTNTILFMLAILINKY